MPEETRKFYETQIGEAEVDLAKSINQTADYISRTGADVSTGSEGYNALVSLSGSVGTLTNTVAVNSVKEGLTGIQNTTGNANLKVIIGSLMLRR